MNHKGLLAGTLAALVLLSAYAGLRAQSPAPGAANRVACVNVVQIFNQYQRQKDLTEEMKQVESRLNRERDERRRKIDALQATIDAMSPNDPAAVDKTRELLKMQIEFKNWFDLKQAEMTREIAIWSARIYDEIVKVTEAVARQDGYQVVLYLDQFQPVLNNPDAIREQIRSRKVLYCDPSAEITQMVLERLNVDYRAQPPRQMLRIP